MSSSNCCFLTCLQISQEASQVTWYSHLFKNFPQFVVIHAVKGFGIVNKAEVDVFSGTLLFFQLSNRCWQFDLWFLYLFKSSLNIWKFTVHILLKPSLKDFEHYLVSTGMNAAIWQFEHSLALPFFGIGMKADFFPVLLSLLSFLNLLAY